MKTEMAELIERANQMIARLSKEAMNKDNLIEKGVFRSLYNKCSEL